MKSLGSEHCSMHCVSQQLASMLDLVYKVGVRLCIYVSRVQYRQLKSGVKEAEEQRMVKFPLFGECFVWFHPCVCH